MNTEELKNKKVMHVDTSCKLYENKNTGISFKIVGSNMHGGIVLSKKLKKELKRDLHIEEDYPRIYSIAIYYLIKERLDDFEVLVICGDENFTYVKRYLDLLFCNKKIYSTKKVISMGELREMTGKKKLKSYADNSARSYRKRGLKSLIRQQEGKELNLVKISYKLIRDKWEEINNILRK
ncbi:MAG: hypothetical protein KKE50_04655 [Nanoarchaeota archaeon]|nr:hypothetical protein [Nanoarchaeota archaeon]